jgi:hypothetical protein
VRFPKREAETAVVGESAGKAELDESAEDVETALEGAVGCLEQPIAAPIKTQQRSGDRVRIVIVFLLLVVRPSCRRSAGCRDPVRNMEIASCNRLIAVRSLA